MTRTYRRACTCKLEWISELPDTFVVTLCRKHSDGWFARDRLADALDAIASSQLYLEYNPEQRETYSGSPHP